MTAPKKSTKTTILGILTIVVALGGAALSMLDDDPKTTPDWTTVLALFGVGAGLTAARDHNVSSKDANLQ